MLCSETGRRMPGLARARTLLYGPGQRTHRRRGSRACAPAISAHGDAPREFDIPQCLFPPLLLQRSRGEQGQRLRGALVIPLFPEQIQRPRQVSHPLFRLRKIAYPQDSLIAQVRRLDGGRVPLARKQDRLAVNVDGLHKLPEPGTGNRQQVQHICFGDLVSALSNRAPRLLGEDPGTAWVAGEEGDMAETTQAFRLCPPIRLLLREFQPHLQQAGGLLHLMAPQVEPAQSQEREQEAALVPCVHRKHVCRTEGRHRLIKLFSLATLSGELELQLLFHPMVTILLRLGYLVLESDQAEGIGILKSLHDTRPFHFPETSRLKSTALHLSAAGSWQGRNALTSRSVSLSCHLHSFSFQRSV